MQRRANFYDLPADDRIALGDLIRSFGVNPDAHVAADFAVTVQLGRCRLHLTQFLTKNGQRYLDVAADRTASRPLVFDVDPERLPAAVRPTEAVA